MDSSLVSVDSDRLSASEPTSGLDPVDTGSLLRLAWPIVVSRSTQVVVSLCDALMVARLGEVALAAATAGALNSLTVLILPMGVSFIIASFSAQLLGRGDRLGARRFGFYGLALALVTEAVCLLALPAIGPVLAAGSSFAPEVVASMTMYMTYRLGAGGAAVGFEALANYYGGLGNTKLPMRISLLTMVANVAFNAIFIFGLLGAPALGLEGAALGSLLSAFLGFGIMLSVFIKEGVQLGTIVPQLHLAELGRMVRFGLPAGFNWFFEFLAYLFFVNVVVGDLGTTSVAAFMTAMEINSVSFMPSFGIASAGAILVGQRIGAGQHDLVPGAVARTFVVAAGWMTLVSIVYLSIPTVLFSAFVDTNAAAGRELLAVGAFVVMCSASWQLCDAAATTLAEALRAAGDTAFTLGARLAIGWLLFVPGSYYSVRMSGGSVGVAVSWLVIYLGLLAIVLYLRFRSGAWRRIKLIEPETS